MDESKEESTKLALPPPPDEYWQKDPAIKEILDKLQESVYLDETLANLKKLAHKMDENTRLVSILLYHYYINIDSRHSMRTSILRILNNTTKDEKKKPIMSESLSEYFDKYIMTHYRQIVKPIQIQQLNSLFTNIPFGLDVLRDNGKDILVATNMCFEELMQAYVEDRSHKLHMSLYIIVKLLVSIVQKNLVDDSCRCSPSEQLGYIFELIIDNSLNFDVRCNAGILFIFYSTHNVEKSAKSLSDYPFLAHMGTNVSPVDMLDVLEEAVDGNTIASVAMYAGLIVWSKEVHLNTLVSGGDVYLGERIFGTLIDYCEKKGDCWIPATRIMLALCRAKFIIRAELFNKIMRFCEQHMDHSIDTVRHSMKNLYKSVLSMGAKVEAAGLRMRFLDVVDSLVVDIKNAQMYHYIIPIAEEFGCQYILKLIPDLQNHLIQLMCDETVSQQLYTTYRSLMTLHHKDIRVTATYETELPVWRSHWINALAQAIRCEPTDTTLNDDLVTNSTIEARVEEDRVFVPQYLALFIDAFKLDRQIIYLLGPVNMRCESQLEAVLKCLHQCYKEGVAIDAYTKDYAPNYPLWRSLIPRYVLERVRSHISPSVRIAALSLIVETGKSCAPFTEWETGYLRRFYAIHAREPNAAARHQMLSLFERAIKRAGDSREVAIRRIAILEKARDNRRPLGDKEDVIEKEYGDVKEQVECEGVALRFINIVYRMAVRYATNVGACHNRRTIALHIISYLQRTYLVGCVGSAGGCGAADDVGVYNASVTLAQGAHRLLMEDGYETIVQSTYMVMVRMGTEITRSSLIRADYHSTLLSIIHLACSIRPSHAVSAAYQLCELLRHDDVASAIPGLYPSLGIEPDNQLPQNSPSVAIMIDILIRMVDVKVQAALGLNGQKSRDEAFYGLLGCIRVLMKEYDLGNTLPQNVWKYFVKELMPLLCHRITALVSPIIGDNAPEGFLPYDVTHTMEDITDISGDSQMILVYAWRSVKEVSLLLGEIAERCPDMTGTFRLEEEFHAIGSYFVNVFLNAKHRGAYEQASVGFQQVCKRLWNFYVENIPWPVTELVKIKFIMDNQDEEGVKKLCPTRRSAGIPFMLQTILATEPKQLQNKHFNETTEQLIQSCDAGNALEVTKLHGMNILRALVRHNELGEKVIPYVSDIVILALRSFDHQSWAVRNSATLLFSALMTRMFGVQRSRDHISKRNQMTYSGFLSRHTKLAQFLLSMMQKVCKDANASMCNNSNRQSSLNYANITDDLVIQPILMILCRLYNCNEDEHIDVILTFLQLSVSNSNFKTRELACEVITTILPDAKQKDYLDKILAMLLQVKGPCNGNYLHGLIMQMSYMFNAKVGAICEKLLDMDAYIQATMWIAVGAGRQVDYCSATEYLELCHHFVTIAKGYKNIEILLKVLLYQNMPETDGRTNRLAMKVKYSTTRLSLIISIITNSPKWTNSSGMLKTEYIAQILARALDPLYCEADTALFILTFVNTLVARTSCASALYTTGELQVPSNIMRLCHAVTTKLGSKGHHGLLKAFERAVYKGHVSYWMTHNGELAAAALFFLLHSKVPISATKSKAHPFCTLCWNHNTDIDMDLTNHNCCATVQSHTGFKHDGDAYSLDLTSNNIGSGLTAHTCCIALETHAQHAVLAPNGRAVTQLLIFLSDLIGHEATVKCVKVAVYNVCVKLVEYAKKAGLDIREFILLWNIIINLLEDEDEEVRNHATLIYKNFNLPQQSYPNTPECTIEVIYQHWCKSLPIEMALIFVMYRLLFSDRDRDVFVDSIQIGLSFERFDDNSQVLKLGNSHSSCTGPAPVSLDKVAAQMAAAHAAHTAACSEGTVEEKGSRVFGTVDNGRGDAEKMPRMKVFPDNKENFHYHERDFIDSEAFKYFKVLIFDIPNVDFDKNQIFVLERLQLATNKLRTLINALKAYIPVQLCKDLVVILAGISDYFDLTPVEDYDNNIAWLHIHDLVTKQCGNKPEVVDTRLYNLLYHIYCFEGEAWEMSSTNPLGL